MVFVADEGTVVSPVAERNSKSEMISSAKDLRPSDLKLTADGIFMCK